MTNRAGIAVALAGLSVLAACRTHELTPQEPGQAVLAPVFVDETELRFLESYPVQVALVVRGSLPTPCHQARWEVKEADVQGRIAVVLYSTAPEGQACIQVLSKFAETIPLGSYREGAFTVWLNGDEVQAFRLP